MLKTLKGFHPIVISLLLGTVMARAASFMAMPFLAIYLSKTQSFPPILIGLVIGISPLMSTFGSFIGGTLSDIIGRKRLMFAALLTWSIVFIGFALASHPVTFFVLNAVNGLCRSFFEPTSQALMADLTPKDKRVRVFSLRYTAINIGASVGPLLGAYFGTISANLTFFITAGVYFIYFLILAGLFLIFPMRSNSLDAEPRTTFRSALEVITRDVALLYFILAGILVNIGYAQIESTLPQVLKDSVPNGVVLYSFLLSFNAVTVVVLQVLMMRFSERLPILKALLLGASLFSLGYIGFGVSGGWWAFIASMFVITVGEIFVFPMGGVIIDRLAPEALRGTYFGANGFRSIGFFIGPSLGGFLLEEWGGTVLFILMAAVVMSSMLFYAAGYREMMRKRRPQRALLAK